MPRMLLSILNEDPFRTRACMLRYMCFRRGAPRTKEKQEPSADCIREPMSLPAPSAVGEASSRHKRALAFTRAILTCGCLDSVGCCSPAHAMALNRDKASTNLSTSITCKTARTNSESNPVGSFFRLPEANHVHMAATSPRRRRSSPRPRRRRPDIAGRVTPELPRDTMTCEGEAGCANVLCACTLSSESGFVSNNADLEIATWPT